MGHVYCKHIKDKTLRGYMVRGVPFLCLYDAKSQCTRIGVEPDKMSLLYAPAQARQVAAISEKEVLYLCSRLDEMQEKRAPDCPVSPLNVTASRKQIHRASCATRR